MSRDQTDLHKFSLDKIAKMYRIYMDDATRLRAKCLNHNLYARYECCQGHRTLAYRALRFQLIARANPVMSSDGLTNLNYLCPGWWRGHGYMDIYDRLMWQYRN